MEFNGESMDAMDFIMRADARAEMKRESQRMNSQDTLRNKSTVINT